MVKTKGMCHGRPYSSSVQTQPNKMDSDEFGAAASQGQKLLTAQEVAERIQVNPSWIYAAVRANQIPHVRLGRYVRFSESAIDQWLHSLQGPSVSITEEPS